MSDTAPSTPTVEAGQSPFTAEVIADVFGADAPVAESGPAVEKPNDAPAEATSPKERGVAERLAVAKRAEIKSAEARRSLEARERAAAEREAKLSATEAEHRLIDEDPAKYFELRKKGPRAIADHLEKLAGTYKPEAVAEQKLTAQEQRIKDLEDKLSAKEAADSAQQVAAVEQAAGQAFIADIAAAADKFPHLTQEFSEQEVVALGLAELRAVIGHVNGRPVTRVEAFVRDNGREPTHSELAEHIDGIAKARIEARAKAAWRKPGNAPLSGSQPVTGDQNPVPTVKGTSPRTLSTRDTSTRAAAPRATGWTQEQADEESLRILEQASKKR